MVSVPFRKMNGLGNEILVLDMRGAPAPLSAQAVREVAERPTTAFDQMMVLLPPRAPGTDAFVRIYNRDGSQSSACGNGARCIAAVVMEESGRDSASFETAAGLLPAWRAEGGLITVDMGAPRFGWQEIPLARPVDDTRMVPYTVEDAGDQPLAGPSAVNVGNPHLVFWVGDVAASDLATIGPRVETDPLFPERINVTLAQVVDTGRLTIRVWERGAGLTRACGSAACAAAVAASRKRLTGRRVVVTLPGGPLTIEWREDDHVLMTGPYESETAGVLDMPGAPALAAG